MKKIEKISILIGLLAFIIFLAFVVISGDEVKRKREDITQEKIEEEEAYQRKRNFEKSQRLLDDVERVKERDALLVYRGFAERFPEHPEINEIQERITDLEVELISDGEYVRMPKAEAI